MKDASGTVMTQGNVDQWFEQMPDFSQSGYTEIKGKKWRFAPPEAKGKPLAQPGTEKSVAFS